MAALTPTGIGTVAEVLGLALLLVGASFSGTELLAGIVGLVKFLTTVDDAKTEEDLKSCGKLFGDAVAKIGVNGLFFVLSLFGLKKASIRHTTRTIADSNPNSGKWTWKSFKENVLKIEEADQNNSVIRDVIPKNLPNVEKAIINPKKLYDYSLNPNHPVGGNKAKVFESALGYNQSNASDLISQLYKKLPESKIILGRFDEYGQRYTVDINIQGSNGKNAIVRTGWIIKTNSDIPELTTLYVKND